MLGLKLRKEFQGKRLKGTAIELANDNKTGATQIPAKDFLNITYPSADLLKAIEGIGPGLDRPTVLIGERGLGKSHIMAVLYHALNDFAATREWLQFWATHTGNTKIASIALREGMHIISESLHRQRYKFLWDLIFDKHPEGKWARGMWEGMGDKKTDVPPDTILLEMFKKQPTALILDEYQTWFDGLTDTKQYPWRKWAFNFIQYLAEIADGNPELLLLVVSVRDGRTDAYQQIQRINPMIIDFEGAAQDQGKRDRYKKDRMRLLLHRLFDNRLQVSPSDINGLINVHVSEFLRLKEISPTEHDQWRGSFTEAWPFSPDLMQLLEDQVLVATYAQETRDLIRILVDLFKCHGDKSPVITAADFLLDDDNSGVAGLLDSVANQ